MPTPPTFATTRTEIAGMAIAGIAREFGTPTFVYDAAKILERLDDLAAFDHVRYAQKACSNLAVVDLLRRAGALVDAVSASEIRRALAAGYAAQGDPPPSTPTRSSWSSKRASTSTAARPT
jgi:diaminopimelate decarboxylase